MANLPEIRFDYLHLTGLSEEEVLKRARKHRDYVNRRFGAGTFTLQDSVHSVIDAAAEYAQGRIRTRTNKEMTYEVGQEVFVNTSRYSRASAYRGVVTRIAKNGRITVKDAISGDTDVFTDRGYRVGEGKFGHTCLITKEQYDEMQVTIRSQARRNQYAIQLGVVNRMNLRERERLITEIDKLRERAVELKEGDHD